jgi:tetratricopeptide (TPR) repeat protein
VGEVQKALDVFTRAEKADPRHWQSLYNQVVVYMDLNRHDEAVAALGRLERVNPQAPRLADLKQAVEQAGRAARDPPPVLDRGGGPGLLAPAPAGTGGGRGEATPTGRLSPLRGGHGRDRECQTFLPRGRALTVRAEDGEHFFCSAGCREAFLARSRPLAR